MDTQLRCNRRILKEATFTPSPDRFDIATSGLFTFPIGFLSFEASATASCGTTCNISANPTLVVTLSQISFDIHCPRVSDVVRQSPPLPEKRLCRGPGPAAYTTIKKLQWAMLLLRPCLSPLYNSRPLKLDPPWSDSHRRRSWTGPSTRSSVSAASRSAGEGSSAVLESRAPAPRPECVGRKGWPASCGNWWRTWRRRPGSAAGARDTPRHTASHRWGQSCRERSASSRWGSHRKISQPSEPSQPAQPSQPEPSQPAQPSQPESSQPFAEKELARVSPQQSYHWRGTRTRWTSSGCECDVSGTTHGSQTLEASARRCCRHKELEDRMSLLKEAELLNVLRHPNVVEIAAVVQNEGLVDGILLEVLGPSLQAEASNLQFAPDLKAALRDVSSALVFMHSLLIAHNDLKAQNVAVSFQSTSDFQSDWHGCMAESGKWINALFFFTWHPGGVLPLCGASQLALPT